jgi:hypothetical protein
VKEHQPNVVRLSVEENGAIARAIVSAYTNDHDRAALVSLLNRCDVVNDATAGGGETGPTAGPRVLPGPTDGTTVGEHPKTSTNFPPKPA